MTYVFIPVAAFGLLCYYLGQRDADKQQYYDGYARGYAEGHRKGFEAGRDHGFDQGFEAGYGQCCEDVDQADRLIALDFGEPAIDELICRSQFNRN